MYDKNLYKRDVTCSWPPPLSQIVTPSRTPSSSVTYFMDGSIVSVKYAYNVLSLSQKRSLWYMQLIAISYAIEVHVIKKWNSMPRNETNLNICGAW